MTAHASTCRFCGDEGLEDETDLMPNTCPGCFERILGGIVFLGPPPTLEGVIEVLIVLGCHPQRIRRYMFAEAAKHGIRQV